MLPTSTSRCAGSGQTWRASSGEEGIVEVVRRLQEVQPTLIVLEATGGYEQELAAHLAVATLPVVVVNPRQVRAFAQATGRLAKTDVLDAHVLAPFAEAVRPSPKPLPDAQAQALAALVERRRELVAMRVAEQNRLAAATTAPVRPPIQAHLAWLEQAQKPLDDELHRTIEASPIWRTRDELLRSVPGMGPVVSATLVADLPELGSLSHQPLAALGGVAPLNRESGTLRGPRVVWGGRARVRTALYMATLVAIRRNPVIQACYRRLLARGKAKKVALVACMCKLLTILNALLRHQTPWQTRPLVTAY